MFGYFAQVNFHLYHYAGNNPVKYTDPTGEVLETAWDAASLVTGVLSFSENAKSGNVKGAVLDGLGIIADVAALMLPCVPGGVGALIKGSRVADKLDGAKDTAKAIKNARQSAVRKAWKQEKEMVESIGQGTRDWSKKEMKELLENGKVKGYQGHHINNVKDHPSMAGDPNNIEFLNKTEHLDAHNGNYRNKTEGPLLDRSIE